MGANLWLSGVFIVGVFWCVGVYNRMTRYRARSLASFAGVAHSLHRYRVLVLEHIHGSRVAEIPASFQQLLQHLERLDQVTQVAQSCPWDKAALAALMDAGRDVFALWSALRTAPADLAGAALPDSLMQDWDANAHVLHHAVGSLNQSLMDYNDALAQFPATVITGFLGFKPADLMAKFYET